MPKREDIKKVMIIGQNVQSTINCFIDVGFDRAVLHRMAFVEATAYVESQARHREERDEIDEEE